MSINIVKNSKTGFWFFVLVVCFVFIPGNGLFTDSAGTVQTPNGTNVNVIIRDWELSPAEITQLDERAQREYPNALFCRSSTRMYNCHSFAWHSQSSSNDKWMNNPDKYWIDGSYHRATGPAGGYKVYYSHHPGSRHSAIVEDENHYISKWGFAPQMDHPKDHCPYISSGLLYYDR